jgi:hypothetical protein
LDFKHSIGITIEKYAEGMENDPLFGVPKKRSYVPFMEGDEKAIIDFNEQWWGRTYKAEKINGEWKIKIVSWWIT